MPIPHLLLPSARDGGGGSERVRLELTHAAGDCLSDDGSPVTNTRLTNALLALLLLLLLLSLSASLLLVPLPLPVVQSLKLVRAGSGAK